MNCRCQGSLFAGDENFFASAQPPMRLAVSAVQGGGFENPLFPEYNLQSAIERGHTIVCVAGGSSGLGPLRSALEWPNLSSHADRHPVTLFYTRAGDQESAAGQPRGGGGGAAYRTYTPHSQFHSRLTARLTPPRLDAAALLGLLAHSLRSSRVCASDLRLSLEPEGEPSRVEANKRMDGWMNSRVLARVCAGYARGWRAFLRVASANLNRAFSPLRMRQCQSSNHSSPFKTSPAERGM